MNTKQDAIDLVNKVSIEILAMKQQVEYAMEENLKKRTDKTLMNDWLTDIHYRLNKLQKL